MWAIGYLLAYLVILLATLFSHHRRRGRQLGLGLRLRLGLKTIDLLMLLLNELNLLLRNRLVLNLLLLTPDALMPDGLLLLLLTFERLFQFEEIRIG